MNTPPPGYVAAVEYVQRGWSVIPINPRSKVPLCAWEEYKARLPTIAELRTWWQKWCQAGVGIVTGRISGLVVVDFDGPEAVALMSEWPESYTVKTPKGAHRYYSLGATETGRQGVNTFGDGIDIRGEGGYVIAPPTVRTDGGAYVLQEGPDEPRWRPDRCIASEVFAASENPDWAVPQEGAAWVDAMLANGVQEPGRNDALSRLAGLFAKKGLDESTAQILLADFARKCTPPMDAEEAANSVASVYRTDRRHRAAEDAAKAGPTELATVDAQSTAPVQLMRFSDFHAKYYNATVEWLVEGWVPKRTIMIAVSPPECFKSWLTTDIAAAIVTGGQLLTSHVRPAVGPVILLQQEDAFGMTARRLDLQLRAKLNIRDAAVALPTELDLFLPIDREFHFGNKDACRRLEEYIDKIRPVLVILDPLYSMVDGKDHMAGAAAQMKKLKLWRDRYDCSFLLVHHTSKSKTINFDRESSHGSQFLNAFVEGGFQIRKYDEGKVVLKRHFKEGTAEFATIEWCIDTKGATPVYSPVVASISPGAADDIAAEYNAKALGKKKDNDAGFPQ